MHGSATDHARYDEPPFGGDQARAREHRGSPPCRSGASLVSSTVDAILSWRLSEA